VHAHVKDQTVEKIEGWLVSEKARNLINSYLIENVQVFSFNAR